MVERGEVGEVSEKCEMAWLQAILKRCQVAAASGGLTR